jgi:hypothetical protein
MKKIQRILFSLFRRKTKMSQEEKTLCQIGALTIIEIKNSREFRRIIGKTDYGKKLQSIVKF